MALAFARFLEADPSQIVMVGDSRHDLDCARAAGAVAVAVLSGPAERGALEPHADFVIDHIGDLPRLLAGLDRGPVATDGSARGDEAAGRIPAATMRREASKLCECRMPPRRCAAGISSPQQGAIEANQPVWRNHTAEKIICFQQLAETTSRAARAK